MPMKRPMGSFTAAECRTHNLLWCPGMDAHMLWAVPAQSDWYGVCYVLCGVGDVGGTLARDGPALGFNGAHRASGPERNHR